MGRGVMLAPVAQAGPSIVGRDCVAGLTGDRPGIKHHETECVMRS